MLADATVAIAEELPHLWWELHSNWYWYGISVPFRGLGLELRQHVLEVGSVLLEIVHPQRFLTSLVGMLNTVDLACKKWGLFSAKWNTSCITTDVESVDTLFLNFIRIIFKYHMSNVIFDTFICPRPGSNVKPHISVVNLAVKGKGDDDILSLWSPR